MAASPPGLTSFKTGIAMRKVDDQADARRQQAYTYRLSLSFTHSLSLSVESKEAIRTSLLLSDEGRVREAVAAVQGYRKAVKTCVHTATQS